MSLRRFVQLPALFLICFGLFGCGPRETPEQHLARLRSGHDIIPTGVVPSTDSDGNPRMIVDLRVTNKTAEKLDHLTILIQVKGPDGQVRLDKPVTLDLSGCSRGVGVQMAAVIDGYTLAGDEQVSVEIAKNLSKEELEALPEYQDILPN